MTATEKRCRDCDVTKPAADFHRDKSRTDGLSRHCKSCASEYERKRNAANPERNRARAKDWAKAHPEKARARGRRWIVANLERKKKQGRDASRRHYWSNPAESRRKSIASQQRFRQNNPAAYRAAKKRSYNQRRARQLGATSGSVNYDRIARRDQMVCHICKTKVQPSDLHFDHVIPLAKYGEHVESNIAVSHNWCNRQKSAKVLTLF